jgi:hypothetical protein
MFMKYDGALVKPNGITVYSYEPYVVTTGVLGISCSLILSRKYLDLRSILENTLAPSNWSNKSLILGSGYFFLIVTSFSEW